MNESPNMPLLRRARDSILDVLDGGVLCGGLAHVQFMPRMGRLSMTCRSLPTNDQVDRLASLYKIGVLNMLRVPNGWYITWRLMEME
ncbi:MAG: hypothetical protein MPK62_00635 [Alphaproteobacteria bacterium]|nr:hypothetical protein [Alphaproteobacteria bacterium]MDA8029644.1 hypothetical protein [Alphaproteobacteria bacterium]